MRFSDCLRLLAAVAVGVLAALYYIHQHSTTLTMSQADNTGSDSLAGWFRARIDGIRIAQEQDLLAEFSHTFNDDARIMMNHKLISLDDFQSNLARRRFAEVGTVIEWKDIVESKIEGGKEESGPPSVDEGIVAGVYVITRSLRLRIRAGPAQTQSHVVFSAKIQNDSDGRKVSEFFLIVVDTAVPVSLSPIPATDAQ
ncbi:hypothetical protein AX15_003808 [Amanita polypyramis BW_CC]|nr:hypothetical protein AX15_003808 [Amanita polypyramis BW_CC]